MQEMTENRFSALELNLDNLATFTREQIFIPTVKDLYSEFTGNGIEQTLVKILNQIPTKHQPPILHTLTTHVTKEKPVFIYGIGESVDIDKAKFIAASTDLLWCLSLMVDDIIDEDNHRAGKKTAWSIYGQQETYTSASVALRTLQDLTTEILSPTTTQLLIETVNDSLKSLEDPVVKNLDSDIGDILHNIDRRARFHCEYPVKALFVGNKKEEIISIATDSLFCVNKAGQILNDAKDLIPSQFYGRELFTDIRSGTTTVPLILLQEVLTIKERQTLRECFNCSSLTVEQITWLYSFVKAKLPRQRIYTLVLDNYGQFLEGMREIVTPKYFVLCQEWVKYKIGQANTLLLN